MTHGAAARTISYDINGTRYTYESSDPQDVESARKRIDAANAADAAKAKAAAERSSTPLVGIVGSPLQQEAAKAEARLKQVLAEQEQADAARTQQHTAQAPRKEHHEKQAEAQPDSPADEPAHQSADAKAEPGQDAQAAENEPATAAADVTTTAQAVEPPSADKAAPTVKSVSFDVESGIKTTIMTDGTAREEPFDSSIVAKLAFEQDESGSLAAFVNRLRRVPAEESTGSTTPRAEAEPEKSSLDPH